MKVETQKPFWKRGYRGRGRGRAKEL